MNKTGLARQPEDHRRAALRGRGRARRRTCRWNDVGEPQGRTCCVEWIDGKLLPVYPPTSPSTTRCPEAALGRIGSVARRTAVRRHVREELHAPVRSGLHPRGPHRRRLRADGERADARVRRSCASINVAQGAMVILGAYLSYSLFTTLHIDPFLSILLIAPADVRAGRRRSTGCSSGSLRPDDAEEMSLLVTWATALGDRGHPSSSYTTNYRSTITELRADTSWTRRRLPRSPRCGCSRSRSRW